ncbi:autotransporter assembly complex protein TamA [Ancylobacter sp. 6x-1]|uniref:Autotransporter assembly complex protein TamA n=1 Tax=Ancylobacter crimeensis TaxID=2579147 RepID=A0ABT0DDQ9_9HYPH|nr:autotransporter assembly complex family protein [Ancylobacter crimeensis]MCK0198101.1 autotransporter assembly complex protein TamA [Ancylobacter crimeensis]
MRRRPTTRIQRERDLPTAAARFPSRLAAQGRLRAAPAGAPARGRTRLRLAALALCGTALAALAFASGINPTPARAQETAQRQGILDSIKDLFNPQRVADREAPASDPTPYEVKIEVPGAGYSLRSSIEGMSNLEALKLRPPSGAAGLVRRAQADFDRITVALYSAGYYAGTIRILVAGKPPDAPDIFTTVEAARKRGPVQVAVTVNPGPLFNFGTIALIDARTRGPLQNAPSLRSLGLEPGTPALADNVVRAEARLVDVWRARSYPFARIVNKDVVADHKTQKLNVTLTLDTGPYATFGTFSVTGADFLPPRFIEDRVWIAPGTPYSPDLLNRLRRRLLEIPAIASVRIHEGDKLDAQGRLPVTIEVSPREPYYVGFSATYSTTEGSAINGYWGARNLFGGAETLRLDASASWFGTKPEAVPDADPFGYKLAATFTKPGIITAQEDLVAEAAVLREVTNAYVQEGGTLLAGIRHNFSDRLSVQVGVDLATGTVEDTQGTHDASVVGVPVELKWDTTNDLLNPSEGFRLSAKLEPFAKLGDAGAGPFLAQGSFSTYYGIDQDNRYILAGRVAGGSLMGVDDIYDVPAMRRFFVGGGGSVRGYDYQAISPRDENDDIIGGLSFFEASAELRIRVTDTIGVVPFMDMGSAFASETPDFSGIKYAAGLGLRYFTAVGPLRLDVAFPLNKEPGDSAYGVYVSLGQSF